MKDGKSSFFEGVVASGVLFQDSSPGVIRVLNCVFPDADGAGVVNPFQLLAEKSLNKAFDGLLQTSLVIDDGLLSLSPLPGREAQEKLLRAVLRAVRNGIDVSLSHDWVYSSACAAHLRQTLMYSPGWKNPRHPFKPWPSMAEVLFWMDEKMPSFGFLEAVMVHLVEKTPRRTIRGLFSALQTEGQVVRFVSHPVAGPVARSMLEDHPDTFARHAVFKKEMLDLAGAGKVSLLGILTDASGATPSQLAHLLDLALAAGEDPCAPLPPHARCHGKAPLDVLVEELHFCLAENGGAGGLELAADLLKTTSLLLDAGARPINPFHALRLVEIVEAGGGLQSFEGVHELDMDILAPLVECWSKVSVQLVSRAMEVRIPDAVGKKVSPRRL